MSGDGLVSVNDRCPFIQKGTTVIGWDGGLSPCLPLLHHQASYLYRRERFARRYSIGNVLEHGLDELWNASEYVDFRRRVQNFDFSPCTLCGGCDLSETNDEDCFGNTFPTCGGCLWAQGVIRCP
jgi:MoaA/NifB/PqqE/SkfB family radical SAM enzyme